MRYFLFISLLLAMSSPAAGLVVDKDTVWQGEKFFSEDVRVMPGVTLTIASGTQLSFSEAGLEVVGNLVATNVVFSGERWEGVLLKGNDSGTKLTDCLIKGAKTGVLVKGGAPVLDKLVLAENKVGVEVRGKAGGQITGSNFTGNEKVGLFIKDDSTTSVTDCRFEKNGRYGAYLYRAKPGKFSANRFVGNEIALMIAYHGSDPLIEENDFAQNEVAIQVDRAARPTIVGNLLLDNRTGLYAYRRADPAVRGNRIEKNDVGVLVAYSSYPQIEGNDFVNNGLALKLEFQSSEWEAQRGAQARAGETATRTAFAGQGMRSVSEADRRASNLVGIVHAPGNWWGDEGAAELEEIGPAGNPTFIHDGRDQATFIDEGKEYPLDKVNHSPWSDSALTERAR